MNDVNDINDEVLVDQSMKLAMNELSKAVYNGKNVSMKEFTKVLIWASDKKKDLWKKEMLNNIKRGVKYEDRKWCGQPYDKFSIPSLGIY